MEGQLEIWVTFSPVSQSHCAGKGHSMQMKEEADFQQEKTRKAFLFVAAAVYRVKE